MRTTIAIAAGAIVLMLITGVVIADATARGDVGIVILAMGLRVVYVSLWVLRVVRKR